MPAVHSCRPAPQRDPRAFADFARLYQAVVGRMSAFSDERRRVGAISSAEAAWFVDLLARFEREFRRWDATPVVPGVDAYLDGLAAHPRTMRLAGHVFLHVCFDLPRVARAAFDAHPDVAVQRMRAIFLAPSFVLRVEAMRRSGLRRYAPLVHLAGNRKALETLAHWVQALRSTAWIHAEIARDAALDPDVFATALIEALCDSLAASEPRPALPGVGARLVDRLRAGHRHDDVTIDRFGVDLHRRLAEITLTLSMPAVVRGR